MIQKKPNQLKKCQYPGCKNMVTQYWKTLTINGVRTKCCQNCVQKEEKKRLRLKKEEKKIKLRQKRERITEKKLDSIFSKLVRSIYPPYCHSSKVHITFDSSHAAHLIGRNNRCVRWDLRNVYPTTPSENLYNQLHVIQLSKRLKEYYNIDIEDWENASKRNTCKVTDSQKEFMYTVFKEGLEELGRLQVSFFVEDLDQKISQLRLEIINKTKLIL